MKAKNRTVLVVDDEIKIVEVVKSYFENSDYTVYEAYNGKDALEYFEKLQPSLIILDLMLPDITGEDVCKQIRKRSHVPIIMLTAKAAEEDVLEGLGIGADEYVAKPFSPRQLVARADALLRRTSLDVIPIANLISFNEDLSIDSLKREVRKKGGIINLTPNEYRILMTLVKYPNKVFTREELVIMALGEDYEGYQRTIDTHIKNLRQKIETDSKFPEYILTVYGVGYRFGGK